MNDEELLGVDIVILNCDNKGYIEKCLESVQKNTAGRFNLIVIDQNSTDGSREWLKSCGYVNHLILNDRNVGAWEGRNQGIRASKYRWIAFFDSDTEVNDPVWLDKMWNYTHDSKVGMIESRVKIHNGSYMFGGFAACLMNKQILIDIGMFDHHFKIGGDMDFWCKFAWSDKWRVAFCDDTDIIHHCGKTINREGADASKTSDHKFYREKLFKYKYGEKFIEDTMSKISSLREAEQAKRGW